MADGTKCHISKIADGMKTEENAKRVKEYRPAEWVGKNMVDYVEPGGVGTQAPLPPARWQ